jgi:hypothetical protein
MYVLNNETHLFVLIDAVGDATESDGDGAQIGFDTGNDEVLTGGHEDRFALVTTGAGVDSLHFVYDSWTWDWEEHCFPFDDADTDHEGLAGAVGFVSSPSSSTAHRVYEFCIPLALIVASPGDTVGFIGMPAVFDSDDEAYTSWPAYFMEESPPLNTYGDLVLSEEPPLTTAELDGDEGEAGWFISDVEVTLTVVGGASGVNSTYYRVDGSAWAEYSEPFMVTGDAVHAVEFYSDDVAGNDEPVRSVAVMIDADVPETNASIEGTMGLEGWLVSEATVAFARDDATSGVLVTMYRLDGGEWVEESSTTLTVDECGAHTLEYYSVDVAGNEESTKSIEFQVDTAAPVTTVSIDGSNVALTVADIGSGATDTMYRVDEGEWTVYDGPFEVRGSGNHTVEFYSTDAAGNNETVKAIEVEGTSGSAIFGLDFWVVLLVLVLIIVMAIAVVFGMRRKARLADSGAVMKDSVSAIAQLYDESSSAWPGAEVPPPPGEEPPPPGQRPG